MDMNKILNDQKAAIEQEMQQLNGQMNQLQQALNQGQARALQLQGAHERVTILIDEVNKYAAENSGGPDRGVEASEVRQDQDESANV